MKRHNNTRKGSAMIIGLITVLIASGFVILYHRLITVKGENNISFIEHQNAGYASRSGVASVQYYVSVIDIEKIPLYKDDSISYSGVSNGSIYHVTVTRKSATSKNIEAPFTIADMAATYEVVSTGNKDGSYETFIAVIDVTSSGSTFKLNLNKAIVTEGDITLKGNPDIVGELADIHSNGSVFLQNGVYVDGDVDAVGDVQIQGTVTIGGEKISGAKAKSYEKLHSDLDRVELPTIRAEDYKDRADYQLISTGTYAGKIYKKETKTYHSPSNLNWNYKNGAWSPKGTPPEGFYFSDGDVSINSNLGSSSAPFKISIASTKNITFSGSSNIAPYQDDLTALANLDIKMTGTASAFFEGIFLAHEQISCTGNSSAVGILISTGTTSTSNTARENILQGNMDFNSSTNLEMPNTSDASGLTENLRQMRKASFEEQANNLANFTDE